MDPVWQNLPVDLSDKICNMLPKVRAMDPDMKDQIKFWHLRRLLNNSIMWFGYSDGYMIVLDDLNMLCESDYTSVHHAWSNTDVEKRLEYYYQCMG